MNPLARRLVPEAKLMEQPFGARLPTEFAGARPICRFDPPGSQSDHPVAFGGQRGIVSDEHERRAARAFQREDEIDDASPRFRVEIAGRFVSEEDRGIGRQSAGERHSLLLAAGKLSRIMALPVFETDGRKFRHSAREGFCNSGEFQRNGYVFQRRHGGDQMKRLEHDANSGAAKPCERVFAELREVGAVDLDTSRVRPLQAGDCHQ